MTTGTRRYPASRYDWSNVEKLPRHRGARPAMGPAEVVRLHPPRPQLDEFGHPVKGPEYDPALPTRSVELLLVTCLIGAMESECRYHGEEMTLTAYIQHTLRDMERVFTDDASVEKARRFADVLADRHISRAHREP